MIILLETVESLTFANSFLGNQTATWKVFALEKNYKLALYPTYSTL
jgi:hypothetical protein